MLDKYKSESTVKPIEWDSISSEAVVYHNFNVVKKEKINEDGTVTEIFSYDVEEYTKDEYRAIQIKDANEAIDDLLIMVLEGK